MTLPGTTFGPEVLVELRRNSPTPLRHQLEEALRDAIRAGRLPPGARLPSTRVLATDLGVSRRLVVEAYAQLVAEGYAVADHGSGTRVAAAAALTPPRRVGSPRRRYDFDFFPGAPDLSAFPRAAWVRALRAALATAPDASLAYPDARGLAETREALAAYLRRARGVAADPERIVVCTGLGQGLALLARTLRRRGLKPIAMENPGFHIHRRILENEDMAPIPVPVDASGIDVEALARSGAAAALATPAHQAPTGVALASERRTTLAAWAREGRLVIEDDYDAEFRYDRAPVGALQGLAPERVVYAGSASKTLAPGLRLGWVVLPETLVDPMVELKALADGGTPVLEQLAFTRMLESGTYDRHLRQMRRRYRARRDALAEAIHSHLPEVEVGGLAAGLHLTVRFAPGFPIDRLAVAARRRSVRVYRLRRYYADPVEAPPGLVLGYANPSEPATEEAVRRIAEAVEEVRGTDARRHGRAGGRTP